MGVSPALADLARRRYPQWAERIWTANALHWRPDRGFDVVRTGLENVPPHRRRDYVAHLLEHVVAPGGRLVIGVFTEERDGDATERQLSDWGYAVAGRTARLHRHPALAYKAVWLSR